MYRSLRVISGENGTSVRAGFLLIDNPGLSSGARQPGAILIPWLVSSPTTFNRLVRPQPRWESPLSLPIVSFKPKTAVAAAPIPWLMSSPNTFNRLVGTPAAVGVVPIVTDCLFPTLKPQWRPLPFHGWCPHQTHALQLAGETPARAGR